MSYKKIVSLILIVVLTYYWQIKIKQGPIYQSDKSLTGKTVVLTGGNAGIGKFTAIEIANRDARVVIASRNVNKSIAAKEEIFKLTGNDNVRVMKLDLGDFDSVRAFAADILETEDNIDYLINNAGAISAPGFINNGLGKIFAINHLGHFLLTNLLLGRLKEQSSKRPVRIINLSSEAYKFGSLDWDKLHFEPDGLVEMFKNYANSKLANVYFTSELNKKLHGYDITTYAVHPGGIYSEIGDAIPSTFTSKFIKVFASLFMRETIYGVQTTMYTMLDDHVTKHSGDYFSECAREELWDHAKDEQKGAELWSKSMKWVGLLDHE